MLMILIILILYNIKYNNININRDILMTSMNRGQSYFKSIQVLTQRLLTQSVDRAELGIIVIVNYGNKNSQKGGSWHEPVLRARLPWNHGARQ